jgi:hypothetical protein
MIELHDLRHLLASPVAKLLREGTSHGAKFCVDDGDTLVIEPESAVPEKLRKKLFDREPEAIAALRLISRIKDRLAAVLETMQSV